MTNDALDSLNFLTAVLQRNSLPMVADNGQLSHAVISEHVNKIYKVLQATDNKKRSNDNEITCSTP